MKSKKKLVITALSLFLAVVIGVSAFVFTGLKARADDWQTLQSDGSEEDASSSYYLSKKILDNGDNTWDVEVALNNWQEYQSIEQPAPVDVVMILDFSASMKFLGKVSEERGAAYNIMAYFLQQYKDTLYDTETQLQLSHGTLTPNFSVVAYGAPWPFTMAKVRSDWSTISYSDIRNSSDLASLAESSTTGSDIKKLDLHPTGSSRTDLALDIAKDLLDDKANDGRQKIVILFSDGKPCYTWDMATSIAGGDDELKEASVNIAYDIKNGYAATGKSYSTNNNAIVLSVTIGDSVNKSMYQISSDYSGYHYNSSESASFLYYSSYWSGSSSSIDTFKNILDNLQFELNIPKYSSANFRDSFIVSETLNDEYFEFASDITVSYKPYSNNFSTIYSQNTIEPVDNYYQTDALNLDTYTCNTSTETGARAYINYTVKLKDGTNNIIHPYDTDINMFKKESDHTFGSVPGYSSAVCIPVSLSGNVVYRGVHSLSNYTITIPASEITVTFHNIDGTGNDATEIVTATYSNTYNGQYWYEFNYVTPTGEAISLSLNHQRYYTYLNDSKDKAFWAWTSDENVENYFSESTSGTGFIEVSDSTNYDLYGQWDEVEYEEHTITFHARNDVLVNDGYDVSIEDPSPLTISTITANIDGTEYWNYTDASDKIWLDADHWIYYDSDGVIIDTDDEFLAFETWCTNSDNSTTYDYESALNGDVMYYRRCYQYPVLNGETIEKLDRDIDLYAVYYEEVDESDKTITYNENLKDILVEEWAFAYGKMPDNQTFSYGSSATIQAPTTYTFKMPVFENSTEGDPMTFYDIAAFVDSNRNYYFKNQNTMDASGLSTGTVFDSEEEFYHTLMEYNPEESTYYDSNFTEVEVVSWTEYSNYYGWLLKFKEWNTRADGTGTSYQPGDIYSTNSNLYLFAIYEYDNFYIEFAPGNSTSGSMDTLELNWDSFDAYDEYTLPDNEYKLQRTAMYMLSEDEYISEVEGQQSEVIDADFLDWKVTWENNNNSNALNYYNGSLAFDGFEDTDSSGDRVYITGIFDRNNKTIVPWMIPGENYAADDAAQIYGSLIFPSYIYDGSHFTFTPNFDTTVVTLPEATKEHYNFLGWTLESKYDPEFDEEDDILPAGTNVALYNTSVKFYPVFEPITYTIEFNANVPEWDEEYLTGSTEAMTMSYGEEATLTPNGFEYYGRKFTGWRTDPDSTEVEFTDGAAVTNLSETNGDIVELYAVWEKVPYTVEYNYTENGGDYVQHETQTAYVNDYLNFDPSVNDSGKDNWTFVGWNDDPTAKEYRNTLFVNADLVKDLNENDTVITVYAIYSKDITVNYHYTDPSGNTVEDPVIETAYNKDVTVEATHEDPDSFKVEGIEDAFEFTGWVDKDKSAVTTFEFSTDNSSYDLYAQYNADIAITYDPNGGSSTPDSQSAPVTLTVTDDGREIDGAEVVLADAIEKEGYLFDGWLNGNDKYNAGATVTLDKDTEFVAQWKAVEYTISYDTTGGEPEVEDAKATVEDVIPEVITVISKPGYRFDGWVYYIDDEYTEPADVTEGDPMPAHDLYAVAQWTAIPYTIYYDTDGGLPELDPVQKTVEEVIPAVDETVEKDGYTVQSWKYYKTRTDNEGQYEYADEIAVTEGTTMMPAHDLYAVAQWEANKYIIHYDSNGAPEGSMEDTEATFDVETVLSENEYSYNDNTHTFYCWNTEPDGTGKSYDDKATVKNLTTEGEVTLYAMWINFEKSSEVAEGKFAPGKEIKYTITFTFPVAADKVVISDSVSDNLTITDTDGAEQTDNTLVWTVENVTAGQQIVKTIKATLNDEVVSGTEVTNIANATVTEDNDNPDETFEVISNEVTDTVGYYTVKYEVNDGETGEAPVDKTPYSEGDIATVEENTLEKEEYSFVGWQDEDGNVYPAGAEKEISGDVVFHAVWGKVTKTSECEEVKPGAEVKYTITVTFPETGVDTAELVDNLPEGLEYVSSEPELTVDGQKLTGTVNKPVDSNEAVIVINAKIVETAANGEEVKNEALVTYDTGYLVESNTDVIKIGYSVVYHDGVEIAEDGSVTFADTYTDSKYYQPGSTATILAPKSDISDHYYFIEWNTEPDGTGTVYDPKDTVAIDDANIDLYAIRIYINKTVVDKKENYIPSEEVTYDIEIRTPYIMKVNVSDTLDEALDLIEYTDDHEDTDTVYHIIIRAKLNEKAPKNGTISNIAVVTAGDEEDPKEFTSDEAVIDTAKWFTVTYDANGAEGSVPVDNNYYRAGDDVTILSADTLSIEGYRFLYWNTDPEKGNGDHYKADEVTDDFEEDVTLYAIFTKESSLPETGAYGIVIIGVLAVLAVGAYIVINKKRKETEVQ